MEMLGEEVVRNVVASVMCGSNIRDLTENFTRRRILQMNASLLVTYLKALTEIPSFQNNITKIVSAELQGKLSTPQQVYLNWFLGLTGKSIQNVLRSRTDFKYYLNNLDKNLAEIATDIESRYGNLEVSIANNDIKCLMNWPSILRFLMAIGAQTLTIRGSEKSAYGKLFEKLILGSLLSLLGFHHIDKGDVTNNKMVFWLSERKNKRESDATALLKAGSGIRFDIGFIGRGNTEISLDKVSRFERIMERGGMRHHIITIILVDTIGANSRIVEMAQEINGNLVQMSGTYWVHEVAEIIRKNFGFYTNHILTLKPQNTSRWIRQKMTQIPLQQFLK